MILVDKLFTDIDEQIWNSIWKELYNLLDNSITRETQNIFIGVVYSQGSFPIIDPLEDIVWNHCNEHDW